MKKYLYKGTITGSLFLYDAPIPHNEWYLIGTIEVEPPKKTVVKEDTCCITTGSFPASGVRTVEFSIPWSAKNVKCTYEVEE